MMIEAGDQPHRAVAESVIVTQNATAAERHTG